jgi:hypothetical protein
MSFELFIARSNSVHNSKLRTQNSMGCGSSGVRRPQMLFAWNISLSDSSVFAKFDSLRNS